jgi:hypothetical protein
LTLGNPQDFLSEAMLNQSFHVRAVVLTAATSSYETGLSIFCGNYDILEQNILAVTL